MHKTPTLILTWCLIATPLAAIQAVHAQGTDLSAWRHYGGSQHGMQYSSLDQITNE